MRAWGILVLITLVVLAPIILAAARMGRIDHWSLSRWDSSGLAPDPFVTQEAVVQVYAAASWGLKGAVADHCWIAYKPENALEFSRYDVVGWGVRSGRPSVRRNMRSDPDSRWAGNDPRLLLDIRGAEAVALIPQIEAAIASYPYSDTYRSWPGPNSNTFIAWIARNVPELGLELPARAIGKDYLGTSVLARTPSDTGYQFSIGGVLGASIARAEGFELSILGFVIGIDPIGLAIKLPGLGRLSWSGSG